MNEVHPTQSVARTGNWQENAPATATEPHHTPKWLSGWAWRGYWSTLGQSFHVVSSYTTVQGYRSDRRSIFGFAALNLVANAINILFGAQKKEDVHQLRFLMQQVNHELAPFIQPDTVLPDPETSLAQKASDRSASGLLKKYSVTTSEFFLRTLGSISLIAPVQSWGKIVHNLCNGIPLTTTIIQKNGFPTTQTLLNANKATRYAGYFSLAGKAFILAAKEPDPYNPEAPSLWNRMREKVMFRASSVAEIISGGWLFHDRLVNQKMNYYYKAPVEGYRQALPINSGSKRLKILPDYYGAAGNASILIGYAPRWYSPYGTREVDMTALYTHIAQGLSALPAAQVEPMVVRLSTELALHFCKKELTAPMIRKQLEPYLKKLPSKIITGNGVQHQPLIDTKNVSQTLQENPADEGHAR